MKYNFETIRPRMDCNSFKWNEMKPYLTEEDEDIIPFSIADMEFEMAPEIIEGIKSYIDRYVLGYSNPTEGFWNSVKTWMKERHNWEVEREWMLNTAGIVNAFYLAVNVFTKPGEGVILMTPCYYPMYHAVTRNGRVLVDNPMINCGDHYEIDFEDLERKAKDENTKLMILCSPHNPTGRVFTREELERIGRICIDNGVMICDDEIHNDLIMPGYHHTVFASISEEFAQHSMICTAPSKTFNLAGMQTSTIIIPNQELREKFHDYQCANTDNPKCSVLGYVANQAAYEHCGPWLDECLKIIYHNYQVITEFLEREIPQVKVTKLEGTYLMWMDFRAFSVDAKELGERMRRDGKLFFDDGYVFGEQGAGFLRWNLACPTRYIVEALERLKKVTDTLK